MQKNAAEGGEKVWRWHILIGSPLYFPISPVVLQDFMGGKSLEGCYEGGSGKLVWNPACPARVYCNYTVESVSPMASHLYVLAAVDFLHLVLAAVGLHLHILAAARTRWKGLLQQEHGGGSPCSWCRLSQTCTCCSCTFILCITRFAGRQEGV